MLGGESENKRTKKQAKRIDNSNTKTLQLIHTWITLDCFTGYWQASLIFDFIHELSNLKMNKLDGD
jgi:isoprenylcysteine carboxyl methyltransferase (ICMT) family protein YpbQ